MANPGVASRGPTSDDQSGLQGNSGGPLLDIDQTHLAHPSGNFCCRTSSTTTHRPEIEPEISVPHAHGTRRARERFRHDQTPAWRERRCRAMQQRSSELVIVIVQDPHQRDEVRSRRQSIVCKITADAFDAARPTESSSSLGCDCRQVEQDELCLRRTLPHMQRLLQYLEDALVELEQR